MKDTCSTRCMVHIVRRLQIFAARLEKLYCRQEYKTQFTFTPFDRPLQKLGWSSLFKFEGVTVSEDFHQLQISFSDLTSIHNLWKDLRTICQNLTYGLNCEQCVTMTSFKTEYISLDALKALFTSYDSPCNIVCDHVVVSWYNEINIY